MYEKYLADSKAYSKHTMTSSSLLLQNSTSLLDFLPHVSAHYITLCAQPLSHVWLFVTQWTVICQVPLSMQFSI